MRNRRTYRHPQSSPRNVAFTLIELLVVIAIIAILAAILFPVFAQARAKVRQASCQSNLKQIGTAAAMYAQDYDETFPGRIDNTNLGLPSAERYQAFFWLTLPPYVQRGASLSTTNGFSGVNASQAGTVFVCLQAPPEENLARNWSGAGGIDAFPLNYIPVATVVEYFRNTTAGQPGWQGGPPMSDFTRPADTVWLTENGNWRAGAGANTELAVFGRPSDGTVSSGTPAFWAIDSVGGVAPGTNTADASVNAVYGPNALPLRNGGQRRISYRHNAGANMLYVDGHVKWMRGDQVFNNVKAAAVREAGGGPLYTSMFDVRQP